MVWFRNSHIIKNQKVFFVIEFSKYFSGLQRDAGTHSNEEWKNNKVSFPVDTIIKNWGLEREKKEDEKKQGSVPGVDAVPGGNSIEDL